jgi:murein DD-endopeptidase MepM/ murein hydrolase activator NlpD
MSALAQILEGHRAEFHQVVSFNPLVDKLYRFDFSANNPSLSDVDFTDTEKFSSYVNDMLQRSGAKYGVGGYNEDRTFYKRSPIFDGDEPRTIHLGVDIWGAAGTIVYAPLGGTVHSFAYHNEYGNYGATMIMQHQLDTKVFFTLYGHLSQNDLSLLKEGTYIIRGGVIGHFGKPQENGNWPPHLHFQVISDLRLNKGDYPGVCTKSEQGKYLAICPDADLVLGMMKYAN